MKLVKSRSEREAEKPIIWGDPQSIKIVEG